MTLYRFKVNFQKIIPDLKPFYKAIGSKRQYDRN